MLLLSDMISSSDIFPFFTHVLGFGGFWCVVARTFPNRLICWKIRSSPLNHNSWPLFCVGIISLILVFLLENGESTNHPSET